MQEIVFIMCAICIGFLTAVLAVGAVIMGSEKRKGAEAEDRRRFSSFLNDYVRHEKEKR